MGVGFVDSPAQPPLADWGGCLVYQQEETLTIHSDDITPYGVEYQVNNGCCTGEWRFIGRSFSHLDRAIDQAQGEFQRYGVDLAFRVVDRRNGEVKQEIR